MPLYLKLQSFARTELQMGIEPLPVIPAAAFHLAVMRTYRLADNVKAVAKNLRGMNARCLFRMDKLSAIVRPDYLRCITKAEERTQHKVHILCLADSFTAPSFVLAMWGKYRLLFFCSCATVSMAIGPFR